MPSVVHTTAANTLSVTIPATTAGNCLVVCVMSDNSNAQASVSGVTLGGAAGNFASAGTPGHGTDGVSFWDDAIIWADPNCAGGQTAIVISGSDLNVASGNGGVVVYEISGLVLSSVVDKTSSGGTFSGTAWSSGATATTTVANEIWIGCACTTAAVTGPSSPWSNTTTGTHGIAGQQIVTSTGAATYAGTQASSNVWAAMVVTLKGGAVAVSGSDTGSGADTSTITASSTETGSGADAGVISQPGTEASSGTDSGTVAASVPGSDTGTGLDTATVSVTSSDTGSGTESGSVTLGAADADTGSGADSGSVTSATVAAGDTGTGAEASSIAATLPAAADTASGADAATVSVSSSDTGTGADTASQAPFIPPPPVLWRAPDKLSKRGGTMG